LPRSLRETRDSERSFWSTLTEWFLVIAWLEFAPAPGQNALRASLSFVPTSLPPRPVS
jgi:hypothetical protein